MVSALDRSLLVPPGATTACVHVGSDSQLGQHTSIYALPNLNVQQAVVIELRSGPPVPRKNAPSNERSGRRRSEAHSFLPSKLPERGWYRASLARRAAHTSLPHARPTRPSVGSRSDILRRPCVVFERPRRAMVHPIPSYTNHRGGFRSRRLVSSRHDCTVHTTRLGCRGLGRARSGNRRPAHRSRSWRRDRPAPVNFERTADSCPTPPLFRRRGFPIFAPERRRPTTRARGPDYSPSKQWANGAATTGEGVGEAGEEAKELSKWEQGRWRRMEVGTSSRSSSAMNPCFSE